MTVESTEIADALTEQQTAPEPVIADTAGPSEDDALGAAFDRIMTNNGADRGPDGKFKSSTPGTETDDAASSGDEGGAGDNAGTSTVPEVAPAPANWNGLDDVWQSIPAEHRERAKAHFDDLHRRMSEQGRQFASVKPIADSLADAARSIPAFQNMQPQEIARRATELAAISVELKRNPVETLLKVAQTAGALDSLATRLSGRAAQPADQHIASLEQKIATLQQRLEQASDPKFIETHVSQVVEGHAAQEAVNQFASDPANSFWPDVEPHLPAFIPLARERAREGASAKDILKSAYDMAVNAIPEVRAKAQAAAKPPVAQLDPKRVEAAKKANGINVKSSSTGKVHVTEEEALSAAYDRAMAS